MGIFSVSQKRQDLGSRLQRYSKETCSGLQIVRREVEKGQLPPLSEYKEAAAKRLKEKEGPPNVKNILPSFY